MPSFEKQPGHYDYRKGTFDKFLLSVIGLAWGILVLCVVEWLDARKRPITIPPLPANYAVLATDGKGHVYWMEMLQTSPFPGGKQP